MSLKVVSLGALLALLLFVVVMSGCGGSKSGASNLQSGSDTYRISSATSYEEAEYRPLVADMQSDGAGTIVGKVSVWNDADTLFIRYDTDEGWEMKGKGTARSYVGTVVPQSTDSSIYKYTPDENAKFVMVTEVPLYVEYKNQNNPGYDWREPGKELFVSSMVGVTGTITPSGISTGITPNEFGLYYGANDVLVGSVDLSLNGEDNLVVNISLDEGWSLSNTHVYVGTIGNPPGFAPGQWPYEFTGNSFTITDLDLSTGDYWLAVHSDIFNGSQTEGATAWNPNPVDGETFYQGRAQFVPNKKSKPHWKSYTAFYFYEGEVNGDPIDYDGLAWAYDVTGSVKSYTEVDDLGNTNTLYGWVFNYEIDDASEEVPAE